MASTVHEKAGWVPQTLLSVVLPAVAGGGVLLLTGVSAWPPWIAVFAVAGVSGIITLRRSHGAARARRVDIPTTDMPIYETQRSLRIVPAHGIPTDAPYVAEVSTRTQLALVVAPSDIVGPESLWVPGTGHNLTLTLTAPESDAVSVRSIMAAVLSRKPFPEQIGLSVVRRRMPDLVLSPDLLQSAQRSVANYRRLAVPDVAILLDYEPAKFAVLQPVTPPPFEIPPGDTSALVFAPVTGVRACVHWRLQCEVACAGRVGTILWDLAVTAASGMAKYHPDGSEPDWTPVYEICRDHWDPNNDTRSREAELEDDGSFDFLAHTSADGSGFLLRPARPGPQPESPEAAALRVSADAYMASGQIDLAVDAYKSAVEKGSGDAAYSLGIFLQRQGDLTEARRWLVQATRKRIFAAFNDLGALAHALGEMEEAEVWFRRAMDEGDWIAAVNLATLQVMGGRFAEGEEILQLARKVDVPGAAEKLSRLLIDQGRLDEVEEMLVRDATRTPGDSLFPGEPVHDRLLRLAGFYLNQRGDISKALDAIGKVIDSESTSLKAIAAAATALDRLTVVLADSVEPRLSDAIRAGTERVSAYRRLFSLDPATQRWSYYGAIADLITISSKAKDHETLHKALAELMRLQRSTRAGE